MPIVYQPSVNGKTIDNAIKAQTQALVGDSSFDAGEIMWNQVFSLLYMDFDTTLAQSVLTYLMSGLVVFTPIPMPLTAFPVLINISSKATAAARNVNNNIKNRASSLTGTSSIDAGTIVWEEFCAQVGQDLIDTYPKAIKLSISHCIPIVPAGVMSPPNVGNLSPLPPIFTEVDDGALASNMSSFFGGAITNLAPSIDSAIKAQTSGMAGTSSYNAASIMWDTVLDILTTNITLNLNLTTTMFLTIQCFGLWENPSGPGNPITSSGPTGGSANLPCPIIIA